MSNKIQYGLSNVSYAKYSGLVNGVHTYAIPTEIKGAVSISLSPSGSNDPAYADNIVYYTTTTNAGYTGDLEIMLIPDSFKVDILGETVIDGVQYENSDAQGSEFALMFQFMGDVTNKRHVMYRCKATRPNIDGKTKEDKTTPSNDKLSLTCMAREGDNLVKANTTETIDPVSYSSWFSAVHQPTLSTLTVTSTAGTLSGNTKLTVTPTLTSGNSYVYKTDTTVALPTYGTVPTGFTSWNGTADITATTGNEIAIIEIDSMGKALKAGKATVTAKA